MKTCYCIKCLQYREEKDFSRWERNILKPKYCNHCRNDITEKAMISRQDEERKIKRKLGVDGLTQSQINYSKSDSAIDRLATRRAIEDFNDRKLINEEIGE
jgi:NAD-dependent SIR2 family protein deacetylase